MAVSSSDSLCLISLLLIAAPPFFFSLLFVLCREINMSF